MLKLSLLCKKYLFWLTLALFVFIPLYPKFPLFSIPGTYVAVRIEDFFIAFVILCWFISILPVFRKLLNLTITQTFLFFWAIGGLSLFSGIFITHSVSPHLGFLHYFRRIETMLLFFVAFSAFSNLKQIKIWVLTFVVVTFLVVLYGLGQQWLSFPVISTTNKEFSKGLILFLSPEARVNSTFAGHYDLAAYLSIFLIFTSAMVFYFKSLILKALFMFISLLGLLVLTLTAARVSFLTAFLGISYLFVLIGKKKLILVLVGLALLSLVISPELRHRSIATFTVNLYGGGGAKYEPPPQKENPDKSFSIENAASGASTPSGVPIDIAPGEPLNTTELGVYRSFGIRLNEEWPRAIRAFYKNPMLGTGYSSITIATDNDYLRSLGETGILGTISLGMIFFVINRELYRFVRKFRYSFEHFLVTAIFCMSLTFFATAIFIDVLEASKIAQIFWMLLGIGYALVKMEEE